MRPPHQDATQPATTILPFVSLDKRILDIRGHRVIVDADLAALYGVTTKRLNQQVSRNRNRFPDDFVLRLTTTEKAEVVANCDHLRKLKFSPSLPFAFTEHGALMAAGVLNSETAVQVSIQIVRVFIQMRKAMASSEHLSRRLDELEGRYDRQFRDVFQAVRRLMVPTKDPGKRIGFRA